ncbi:MAG: hypothetical protein HY351_02530 [Candidatus Omnitrophica bacterium]|nr:hypothetical protein [Candidatus Omnitrophota bacterium]
MKAVRFFLIGIFLVILCGASVLAADSEIMARCKKVHEDNYEYLEICVKNQEEAKKNLQSRTISPEIMARCQKTHEDNYEYLEICVKNQEEAKARLGL